MGLILIDGLSPFSQDLLSAVAPGDSAWITGGAVLR
jgi:hypothetical protein